MMGEKKDYGVYIRVAALGALATGIAVGIICGRFVVVFPVTAASFFWLVVLMGIGIAIEERGGSDAR